MKEPWTAYARPMTLNHRHSELQKPVGYSDEGTLWPSLSDGTAVIEIAEASGITTAHDGPRDPVTADTYGTGMLVVDAVRRGARHVVLRRRGIGHHRRRPWGHRGHPCGRSHPRNDDRADRRDNAILDAAQIFGPQKGADTATVDLLTRRLDDQAQLYPRDPRKVPGGGAAGGFAGGMWAVFDAQITPGADFVLDRCGFDDALQEASAVIVGEGRLDSQTTAGKIISAILRRAHDLPIYAVVGSVGDYSGNDFADVLVASDAAAMRRAGSEIASLTRRFVRR